MVKYYNIKLLYLTKVLLIVASTSFAQNDYQKWLLEIESDAIKFGISKKTYHNSILKLSNYNEKVLSNYNNQPEVKITFDQYFKRNIPEKRIRKGKLLLKENLSLLKNIQKEFKVPPEIVIAVWGIETNYGTYTGNYNILDSLSTLAYKSRRKAFFRKEFFYALKIIEERYINEKALLGSWAGAMGQSQFMPSSYVHYAVDYNKDSIIDIWKSYEDIFASISNYLYKHGWNEKKPWLHEIDGHVANKITSEKKLSLAEIYKDTEKPKAYYSYYDIKGKLLTLGKNNSKRYFLVYPNFFILKKYNNSNYYALTLGELANRINK